MRFLQWLSRIGLLLAIVCFGLATYYYWLEMDRNRPEHEIYHIENATIILDNVVAGSRIPVTYKVRNLSNHPIQVVGMEFT